jgi:hypothetical protein
MCGSAQAPSPTSPDAHKQILSITGIAVYIHQADNKGDFLLNNYVLTHQVDKWHLG